MGSDRSPEQLFEGILLVAKQLDPSYTCVLFVSPGIESRMRARFQERWPSEKQGKIAFIEGDQEEVEMEDSPLLAVKRKRGASLFVGLKSLKAGKVDCFLSCGNTGALIAGAALTLSRLPGIDRPALLACLPTAKGPVAVLDVGGNVSCRPQHIVQFAHLGAAYQSCVRGLSCPKVGLLNIGMESGKGTAHVVKIYQTIKDHCERLGDRAGMSFKGNVEGIEVYHGAVDVLVTDGFTGNVFLKSSEGVSNFILEHLRQSFEGTNIPQAEAVMAGLHKQVDYAEYPGAIVCGVEGVVVKCHGYSSTRALVNGVLGMIPLVSNGLIKKIRSSLNYT